MKRRPNNPKKQHVVPSSYLKRFADASGFLHVFDRSSNKWRRQRPKEVMHIRNYYRQEWAPAGVDQNVLEKSIGEWLESAATTVINRLISPPLELRDEDIANFLVYLEFQRVRVPRQIEMAKDLMKDMILRLGPPDITADIRSGKFQLTMKKSAGFHYLRMMVGQLHPWFARMKWEVIKAEEGAAFITTDSPLSLWNAACLPPAEAGIGLVGTVVLFPLSSQYLLVMRHPEYLKNTSTSCLEVLPEPRRGEDLLPVTTGRVWSKRMVANHNKAMVHLSDRLVVGQSKEVLEECVDLVPSLKGSLVGSPLRASTEHRP